MSAAVAAWCRRNAWARPMAVHRDLRPAWFAGSATLGALYDISVTATVAVAVPAPLLALPALLLGRASCATHELPGPSVVEQQAGLAAAGSDPRRHGARTPGRPLPAAAGRSIALHRRNRRGDRCAPAGGGARAVRAGRQTLCRDRPGTSSTTIAWHSTGRATAPKAWRISRDAQRPHWQPKAKAFTRGRPPPSAWRSAACCCPTPAQAHRSRHRPHRA